MVMMSVCVLTDQVMVIAIILQNDFLRGDKESYPFSLNKAYKLLVNWKNDPKNLSRILEDDYHKGISFFQTNNGYNNRGQARRGQGLTSNNNNQAKPNNWRKNKNNDKGSRSKTAKQCYPVANKKKEIICFNCGEKGHMSFECPHPPKKRKDTQLLIDDAGAENNANDDEFAFITHHTMKSMDLQDAYEYDRYLRIESSTSVDKRCMFLMNGIQHHNISLSMGSTSKHQREKISFFQCRSGQTVCTSPCMKSRLI